MASQPPQIPNDEPATSQPASPVPAPGEKPPVEPGDDDAEQAMPNDPPSEPVWPT